MSYLRNLLTGAVTTDIDSNGAVYRALTAQRAATASTVVVDPLVQMEEGGVYSIQPSEPVWEDQPYDRIEGVTTRVAAALLDAATIAVDSQSVLFSGFPKDITITAATYTPNADIVGAETNFRTISVVSASEAAAPVTAAKVAFSSAPVTATKGVPKALTLEEAAKLKALSGVNLVAESKHTGTGIVDPGGLVLVTFTID